jgi:hypothetical protein
VRPGHRGGAIRHGPVPFLARVRLVVCHRHSSLDSSGNPNYDANVDRKAIAVEADVKPGFVGLTGQRHRQILEDFLNRPAFLIESRHPLGVGPAVASGASTHADAPESIPDADGCRRETWSCRSSGRRSTDPEAGPSAQSAPAANAPEHEHLPKATHPRSASRGDRAPPTPGPAKNMSTKRRHGTRGQVSFLGTKRSIVETSGIANGASFDLDPTAYRGNILRLHDAPEDRNALFHYKTHSHPASDFHRFFY